MQSLRIIPKEFSYVAESTGKELSELLCLFPKLRSYNNLSCIGYYVTVHLIYSP